MYGRYLQKCEPVLNENCSSAWHTLSTTPDALWEYEIGEWKLLAYHFNATRAIFYRAVMQQPSPAVKELAASGVWNVLLLDFHLLPAVVPFDDPHHRSFIINVTHKQQWDAVNEPNGKIFQGDELHIDCLTAKSVP